MEGAQIAARAVCVYPNRVPDAFRSLCGTPISVASVAGGFPAGQTPLGARVEEIRRAVADGAEEIDIVLNRTLVFQANWAELYKEVKEMKEACGKEVLLKTILATGELPTYKAIYQASLVCMMAGTDFVKTSTGKEAVNATIAAGIVMCRAIREYYHLTGYKVGLKAAGGIRSVSDSCAWLSLMMEELGEEWTHPRLFRIGASSLLQDLDHQLHYSATGTYPGKQYIPIG